MFIQGRPRVNLKQEKIKVNYNYCMMLFQFPTNYLHSQAISTLGKVYISGAVAHFSYVLFASLFDY